MAVDLKLDIIYYSTPTDFEMEFSLSSRCVMRMLTSKAENAKDFLNDLSRAVSRSRVIMCVGDIYDKSGIINITAQAVGLKLCSYDIETYRVKDKESQDVLLPDGALPLVSEDGVLGGCLIESGPQIIIFLSNDKPLRKRILKELVFEYIMALSGVNIDKKAPIEQNDSANTAEENADVTSQEAEETDESVSLDTEQEIEQEIKPANEPTPENESEQATHKQAEALQEQTDENTDDSNIILSASTDSEPETKESADYNITDDLSGEIDRDFQTDNSKQEKRSRFLGLKITIGILCGILAAITGVLIYYYIG